MSLTTGAFSLPQPALVIGVEICTPVGIDAAASEAEAIAGTVPFQLTELGGGTDSEPVRASRLALIDEGASRTERMKALAATAFRNHLELTGEIWEPEASLPTVLALPEPDAEAGEVKIIELQRALESVAAAVLPRARLFFPKPGIHALGRAAFFCALAQGVEMLRTGKHEAVIVGAVDSWCDGQSLQYLARKNRILGESNGDGLVPGEAAGFALLVAPHVRLPTTLPVLRLLGVSLSQEQHHFLQPEPNLANGLTLAFRQLASLPTIGNRRVDHLLSCQTGEIFWGEEFSRAYLRNASMMPEPLTEDLAAETLGDAGAASAVFQLRMAFHYARRAKSKGSEKGVGAVAPRLLIYGGSDAGLIGSCVVEAVGVEQWATQRAHTSRADTIAGMLDLDGRNSAGATVTPVAGLGPGDREAVRSWALERGEYHVDELGFLSFHRLTYFGNPTVPWTSVADLDARLIHHLSAFEAWGRPALTFARTDGLQAEDDDTICGAVLALASVGSEKEDWPALRNAIASLVEQRAEARIAAWLQGMKLARGDRVGSYVEPLLASPVSRIRTAAAEIMGYRRQGSAERLAQQLQCLVEQQKAMSRSDSDSARPWAEMNAIGLALARMGCASARPLLEKAVATTAKQAISPDVVFAAASLGSDWALDVARHAISANPDGVEPALYVVLGLGSGKQDVQLFASLRPQDSRRKQALYTAMGILGVSEFVPRLIERLGNEKEDEVRLAAAKSLQRITGAGLRETVPEPPDEMGDPDDDGERRMVERTSTDPQSWSKWWTQHERSLSPAQRFRMGRPFQIEICIEEALASGSEQRDRALAIHEFVMRSAGLGVARGWCEPDEYIEQQLRILSSWRNGCGANRRPIG